MRRVTYLFDTFSSIADNYCYQVDQSCTCCATDSIPGAIARLCRELVLNHSRGIYYHINSTLIGEIILSNKGSVCRREISTRNIAWLGTSTCEDKIQLSRPKQTFDRAYQLKLGQWMGTELCQ